MPYTTNQPNRLAGRELLRILGVAFGVAVVLGGTIGVGILRTPGAVVAELGTGGAAIAIWVIGGLFALLGASALADLVTSIPRSGGFYVFARHAMGDAVGFAIGWADWFTNCTALAYGAIIFSEYIGLLFPDVGLLAPAPGAAVIFGLAAVQLAGMRLSSRVQEITSFAKAVAFLLLVFLLFTAPAAPAGNPLQQPSGGFAAFAAVIVAFQLVIGAYDGWQNAMYFAGEDVAPEKNVPRSLIGGVAIVILVYLLVNAAFLYVLPVGALAESTLPAADAAEVALGPAGNTAVIWLAALSLLPLISAVLLAATRVCYAMGRDGLLPEATSRVSRGGTPMVALWASTAIALGLLMVRTFDLISAVMAFFALTSYAGAFVALLIVRRREPHLPRPFRSWGYPWTTLLVLTGALAMLAGLVVSTPTASLIATALLVASYPVYRVTRRLPVLPRATDNQQR